MAFTVFDLSTAEFPDSSSPGSYSSGALVPTTPDDGMVFWLPGMSRDLTLPYTLVVDFEVTGESPYTFRPRAEAFSYDNGGAYVTHGPGNTLAIGDTNRKPVQSVVVLIPPGDGFGGPGDATATRVALWIPPNVPPVTGVRWQGSSSPATGVDFASAQAVDFGQVYPLHWPDLPAVSAENTALGTSSVVKAAWFSFTMPTTGMLQPIGGSSGASIYSGSSLGSLTFVADANTNPELSGGSYYLRATLDFDPGDFTSYFTLIGYQPETFFGPWITRGPIVADIVLQEGGEVASPIDGTGLLTEQQAATVDPWVSTWDSVRVDSGTGDSGPFDSSELASVIVSGQLSNPVSPAPPASLPGLGIRILNQTFDDLTPGSTDGHRDYGAASYRTPWFIALRFPASTAVDSMASGWQNEDGTSDVEADAVATGGDLTATFQHNNITDDSSSSFTSGAWTSTFATIDSATLDGSGHVVWDAIAHSGAVSLWSFGKDADNATEDRSTGIDLSGLGDVFGLSMWTDMTSPVTEDKTGHVGTTLTDGTFTVSYDRQDIRARYEGIEVLLPLFGEVVASFLPPLRQYPREDGLASSSARRLYPPPRSIQASNRRVGGYL